MTKKLSVALIPGFSEGRWHTSYFKKRLAQRGYVITLDASSADIIIAHSGGSYRLPELGRNQFLMLINPTYWPGKSLGRRALAMCWQLLSDIRPGNRPLFQIAKTLHYLCNLPRHALTNLTMIIRSQDYDLKDDISHPHTLLIRNAEDPWLTPDLDSLFTINPNLRLEVVAGGHDDCWQHPDRYIDLLPAGRSYLLQ